MQEINVLASEQSLRTVNVDFLGQAPILNGKCVHPEGSMPVVHGLVNCLTLTPTFMEITTMLLLLLCLGFGGLIAFFFF